LVVTGLVLGLVFAISQPVVYSAVSRIALTPQEAVAAPEPDVGAPRLVSLDSDAQLLASTSVLAAAAASLSFPATADALAEELIVSAVPNSRVLIVRLEDSVAAHALEATDAIVTAFLTARAAAAESRSSAARASLTTQIDDVTERLVELQGGAGTGSISFLADQLEERQLNAQLDDLRAALAALPTAEADPGLVVSPARQRGAGQRPMAAGTVAAGVLLGLVSGLGLAWLSDRSRPRRLRTRADARPGAGRARHVLPSPNETVPAGPLR
jgi:uncharacterized protein involved in exopolysaccharide biosynthesis